MLHVALITPEEVHRIERGTYEQMVSHGLFTDQSVELIDGIVIDMSPIEPAHAATTVRLHKLLLRAVGDRAELRAQDPIRAAGQSMPQPDLAVVPPGDYDAAHPDQALLIIEVADSSLRKDRLVKGPLYALSGFAEYWIVNLVDHVLEAHRGPSPAGWSSITRHGHDEVLTLVAFPDVQLRVGDFLR